MGYFFQKTETENQIIYKSKTLNFWCFALALLLLFSPAVWIATQYFESNLNLFRIPFVLSIIFIIAILDGKAFVQIFSAGFRVRREGSILSTQNPTKYIIEKKK